MYFSAVEGRGSLKDDEFSPRALLPRLHWLTLTSQYDADAIYLSPPDITTVHPAAGARGPHTISIAYKHITLSQRSYTHLRLTFALMRCTGYCHNKTSFKVGKAC